MSAHTMTRQEDRSTIDMTHDGLAQTLEDAARVVADGGVIAYPTEYCFGLGCDPRQAAAVSRLLQIKRRARDQGVLLIASSVGQLKQVLHPDVFGRRRELLDEARTTWPGPVSWVMPAHPRLSPWICGTRDTVGVRVTRHAVANALCRACATPLVSTSANHHGRQPARTAEHIDLLFGDSVDYVVRARVGGASGPSELREAGTGRVLRAAAGNGRAA